tara:strand:+ start:269 stop:658 length:390 start_codon:yes stop_codon:yes gene_type:complete
MTKVYFELDKVESMTLITERESGYKWFEEVTPTFKTFLGFKYNKKSLIPAGWSDYESGRNRVQSPYLIKWGDRRVDELNKKVYEKARITLHLNGDNRINANFNSDEEADDYAFELMEGAKQAFHVIEIK